ncbi:MAG TPA: hypothetical protein DCG04_15435, partial [Rhodospirillaceae bacterium]|nr:hypothetical protein [Rhodospirillaceae bacterium]
MIVAGRPIHTTYLAPYFLKKHLTWEWLCPSKPFLAMLNSIGDQPVCKGKGDVQGNRNLPQFCIA